MACYHVGGHRPYRFMAELGPAPTEPDEAAARRYHVAVMELLDRDDQTPKTDPARCTRSERAYLTMLYRRWLKRATGQDLRWRLVGSFAGTLPRAINDVINPRVERESRAWRTALDGGMTQKRRGR